MIGEPVADEEAILARLREVGHDVASLADLRGSGVEYPKAVPVLVDALSATSEKKTLMEIVRALSVPWAKPAATGPLIDLFRRVDDPTGLSLRWAIGNALDVVWDDSLFDELVGLARDRSYARAREMVVLGLARSKRPEAGDVLIELLDDPEVNGHAVKALAKLKLPRSKPGLQRMTTDSRAWVRKAAEGALKKLA
ncbi:hypothetical protein DNL40_11225 [Xylanimonas oleitrophica]|uniref:HEAT repeat domain-containing protein n=1 Tax=Xylanimonas oleitrophica TaxID=2607479 RepID=A0A2W5WNC4_9MICO|nr:HEAT repeat domain-containing protein [Xylanimonas oleitrophica]PZR52670.1 hypothetical protein DNL40_11225 [Xylanimonas oleitrophica]